MYTVYKHTAPGGKVYIGITTQTTARRWKNGSGYKGNAHFTNAIKLYGWENIQHEIIAEGLTLEQAAALEIELIAKYDSANPDKGYNSSTGGEHGGSGAKRSPEARQRMSEAHKGIPLSEEHRQRLSEAHKGIPAPNKGKKASAETRQRLSEARRGVPLSEEHKKKIGDANRGENSAFYGKPLSDEHRQRLSEAAKGKPKSEEHRQNISAGKTGKPLSDEHRRRLSEAHKGLPSPLKGKPLSEEHRRKNSEAHKGLPSARRKPVICIETGAIYNSTTEAAAQTGAQQQKISAVCLGKRQTAGGYHWKYIKE